MICSKDIENMLECMEEFRNKKLSREEIVRFKDYCEIMLEVKPTHQDFLQYKKKQKEAR